MLDLIRQRAQSWGVKIAFGIIIIVFVFWGVGAYDQAPPNTVATVNGRSIPMKEFERAYRDQSEELRRRNPGISEEDMQLPLMRRVVLDRLVTQSVVEQEAERIGVSVTTAELAKVISAISAFQDKEGRFDKNTYVKVLESNGQNPVDFEQTMRREMLVDKMRMYMGLAADISPEDVRRRMGFQMDQRKASYLLFPLSDYTAKVTPSDEDIKKYYEANKAARFTEPNKTAIRYIEITPKSLAPAMTVSAEELQAEYEKGPLRYHVSTIFLPVAEGADAKPVQERLEKVQAELKKGGDFAKLVAAELEDPQAGNPGWIPRANLPAELVKTLQTMKKGTISAILTVPGGRGIIKLEGTEPDWEKPAAEVKTAVKQRLAEDKALLTLGEVRNQAIDLLDLNKPLDEIAKTLKLDIQSLPLAPRETLPLTLKLKKAVTPSQFAGKPGTLVESVLELPDGYMIAAISEQVPAADMPLEQVRPAIVDVLKNQEAAKLAENAAREVLKGAESLPAALQAKVKTSEQFTRRSGLNELGAGPDLSEALFSVTVGTWLPRPYEAAKGVVIAKPSEDVPLKDDDWKRLEGFLVPGLIDARQAELSNLFVQELIAKSKITMPRPDLFQETR